MRTAEIIYSLFLSEEERINFVETIIKEKAENTRNRIISNLREGFKSRVNGESIFIEPLEITNKLIRDNRDTEELREIKKLNRALYLISKGLY